MHSYKKWAELNLLQSTYSKRANKFKFKFPILIKKKKDILFSDINNRFDKTLKHRDSVTNLLIGETTVDKDKLTNNESKKNKIVFNSFNSPRYYYYSNSSTKRANYWSSKTVKSFNTNSSNTNTKSIMKNNSMKNYDFVSSFKCGVGRNRNVKTNEDKIIYNFFTKQSWRETIFKELNNNCCFIGYKKDKKINGIDRMFNNVRSKIELPDLVHKEIEKKIQKMKDERKLQIKQLSHMS